MKRQHGNSRKINRNIWQIMSVEKETDRQTDRDRDRGRHTDRQTDRDRQKEFHSFIRSLFVLCLLTENMLLCHVSPKSHWETFQDNWTFWRQWVRASVVFTELSCLQKLRLFNVLFLWLCFRVWCSDCPCSWSALHSHMYSASLHRLDLIHAPESLSPCASFLRLFPAFL